MCSIVHSYEDGMAEASSVKDLMDLLSIPVEEVFFYDEYKGDPVELMLDGCLCPVRLKKTIEHAGWEYQKSNGDPTDIDVTPPLEKSVLGQFFIQNHMAQPIKKKPVLETRRSVPVRTTTARTGLSDVVLEEAANVVDGVIQAALSSPQYQAEEVPSESHASGHDASYGGSSGYDSGSSGYDSGGGGYDSGGSSDGGGGCDGGCGGGD